MDFYDTYYYEYGSDTDPQGQANGKSHVLRGGAWGFDAYGLRAYGRGHGYSYRSDKDEEYTGLDNGYGGFRVACSKLQANSDKATSTRKSITPTPKTRR